MSRCIPFVSSSMSGMSNNEHRALHPFFERTNNSTIPERAVASNGVHHIPPTYTSQLHRNEDFSNNAPQEIKSENKFQRYSENAVHPSEQPTNNSDESCHDHGPKLSVSLRQPSIFHVLRPRSDHKLQPREGSRKRRRITSHEFLPHLTVHEALSEPNGVSVMRKDETSNVEITHSRREEVDHQSNSMNDYQTSSSDSNLEEACSNAFNAADESSKEPRETRDAEPRSPVHSIKNTMLAVLRYGAHDEEQRSVVGREIERIFRRPKNGTSTSLPTHPFFRSKVAFPTQTPSHGNAAPKSRPVGQASRGKEFVMSFSTPGRMQHQAHQRFDELSSIDADEMLVRSSSGPRAPGTFDPAWPAKGFVNVGTSDYSRESHQSRFSNPVARAKKKNVITQILPAENILLILAARAKSSVRVNKKAGVSRLARRPTRLVMSGHDICHYALRNLDVSADGQGSLVHCKLQNMLRTTVESMTPFDTGECEIIPWMQKHMPKSTEEVLQPRREMQVLRNWLKNHTVMSTQQVAMKPGKSDDELKKHKKKRRRRYDDLDGFVVESDEEPNHLRDLNNDVIHDSFAVDSPSRSLVRDDVDEKASKDRGARAKAVILSGPHGCGKTAAVFAAANELGFEVFEIGPGSRRGGKEILEKVGDMALNHLVSQHSANHGEDVSVANETRSEKLHKSQKTLSYLFGADRKGKSSVKWEKAAASSGSPLDRKSSCRHKQSLILFEEVDILFDQDKQFWETVLDLAVQSKRPIVMTCTDEGVVPIEDLRLHAILRFQPPPEDLASKYLVLLAAAEGHLIHYEAAAALYKLRGCDLRASIIDLDFWCQMAIGDHKGGLEWHLDRWPPGVDLDDRGNKLRVVSEDTILTDTGVFGLLDTESDADNSEKEEMLLEAWSQWGLQPSQISYAALNAFRENIDVPETRLEHGNTKLRAYENFSDLISATDIFSAIDLPSHLPTKEIQDPTQPLIPDSQKGNFTEKPCLLQTASLVDHSRFNVQIELFMHLAIKQLATHVSDAQALPKGRCLNRQSLRNELLEILLRDRDHLLSAKGTVPEGENLFSAFETLRDDSRCSCFDRESHTVAEDVAPYIRAIAAYEIALERSRQVLYSTTEQDRERGLRKTRASRSAFEGGRREDTRKERWFCESLDLNALLKTGVAEWSQLSSHAATEPKEPSRGVESSIGNLRGAGV